MVTQYNSVPMALLFGDMHNWKTVSGSHPSNTPLNKQRKRRTILVLQHVLEPDLLSARVLRARTPHDRVLHLLRNLLMNRVTEVLDGALPAAQHDGRVVVGRQPARLRVHAHEVERLPHLLDELVDVPPLARGHGDGHRDAVQQVELLDRDRVDLVEHVDGGDVDAVALDDVDEIVRGRAGLADRDVGVVDAVLAQDGLDLVVVDVRERDGVRDRDAALVL